MKKIILLILTIVGITGILTAQNYRKIFYRDMTLNNVDYKIILADIVATPSGFKLKFRIENNSRDYIIYKPNESTFIIGGREYKADEKPIAIKPLNYDYRIINLSGPGYMLPSDFTFIIDGIYKTPLGVGSINATNLVLPPKETEFAKGNFHFTVTKFMNVGIKTHATFLVKYTGDKTGLYVPGKVKMTMKEGEESINFFSEKNPQVFFKGDELPLGIAWKEVPLSMGNMARDQMTVIWKDAFLEVDLEKVDPQKVYMYFDRERSNDMKNKK